MLDGVGALYSSRVIKIIVSDGTSSPRTYENLHFAVTIKRSVSDQPDSCDIEMYNLNGESRNFIAGVARPTGVDPKNFKGKVTVMLENSKAYSGSVINAYSERDLTTGDYKTTIYAGTNPAHYTKELDIKVPKGGNAADEVVAEMKKEFPDFKGIIEGLSGEEGCLKNKTILRAMTINGTFINNFRKIIKDCFPNEDIFIYPTDDGMKVAKAGDFTGSEITVGDDLLDPAMITEEGVNVNILLNLAPEKQGKLIVDTTRLQYSGSQLNLLQLEKNHSQGQGTYMMMEIVHTFDNFSDQLAKTTIVGKSIKATR